MFKQKIEHTMRKSEEKQVVLIDRLHLGYYQFPLLALLSVNVLITHRHIQSIKSQ